MEVNNKIGFKLKSLLIEKNPVLGAESFFNFYDENNKDNSFHSTVIIGPNGTGKSYLLRVIIDAFRELDTFIANRGEKRTYYVKGEYFISYYIDGNEFAFGNLKSANGEYIVNSPKNFRRIIGFKLFKNNEPISMEKMEIPHNILATSIMLTDKFPIVKDGFDSYKYLGVRREKTPSVAGSRTYITRTVENSVNAIDDDLFHVYLRNTLDFLELEHSFYIKFYPRYKHKFFNGNIDSKFFIEFFDNFWEHTKRNKENPPWSKEKFDKDYRHNKKLLEDLAVQCNKISQSLIPEKREKFSKLPSRKKYFGYDILNREIDKKEYKLIKHLKALDLISSPTIDLKKKNKAFSINESSSGEIQLLSSTVTILSNMQANSLVLIDEPEISLHPNWQMKYMEFLYDTFSGFQGCHFIIATHSHFLISDLNGERGSIIGLKTNGEVRQINNNTYGWSAEQVLLDIFEVPTTRNYYVAEKFGRIMKELNSEGLESIDKHKDELLFWFENLKDSDPIHYAISKLIERKKWLD